ncbi:Argininosuccinate lyase [Spirochaeta thermophila DSM 6578]|uniref:Argininosuccinate lyase n=1 Tax=Winmispira thermophila (strain ATCC 700085 / DSM 6578 / Z-1203) TaxID=869211 RepID=G0GB71_WINT7|nr:argininosuccinate lyase [Spirochaeta thermophila]AEJ61095.1 Argininosuccinate lyase [Spirochaeta thermophila DSM 6578]
MGKLWDKGYETDKVIERYTVGEDYVLDRSLLPFDCLASIAHVRMLAHVGIISDEEGRALEEALRELLSLVRAGKFEIRPEDEDGHTAIENWLVARLGEIGKKVHTGRSRNDQVLVALRLYMKDRIHLLAEALAGLIGLLLRRAEETADVPMPGRTHMQIAMPSSCGLWFAAFAEELVDVLSLLLSVHEVVDQNPLGAAASYGVPLPLDRAYTTRLLGFSRVQNNVLYANNSRGKCEAMVVDACEQVMLTLSKLAQDVILFSLPEFGYMKLPPELCTGSSIMPQKQNPDSLELLRAKAASVGAWGVQIKGIIRSLPSGYNRDFQETKGPFMRAVETTIDSVVMCTRVVEGLVLFPERMRAGFSKEIFATDEVYRLVQEGKSFRDAYREVASRLDSLPEGDPDAALRARTYPGTPGNLNLGPAKERLESLAAKAEEARRRFREALAQLETPR